MEWTSSLPIPTDGLGFHPWETDIFGTRFRWTRRLWANQRLDVEGSEGTVRLRSDHPGLETEPLTVEIDLLELNASRVRCPRRSRLDPCDPGDGSARSRSRRYLLPRRPHLEPGASGNIARRTRAWRSGFGDQLALERTPVPWLSPSIFVAIALLDRAHHAAVP